MPVKPVGECPPEKCDHPAQRMYWYDGSVICCKCRNIWHDNFPYQAGPIRVWGKPDKQYSCTCSIAVNPACPNHSYQLNRRY